MEQQIKNQLKQIRIDTEKWFEEVDKEINQQKHFCFCCEQEMDINDAHIVNFDNDVTASVCWKCYDRMYLDGLSDSIDYIDERGEDI